MRTRSARPFPPEATRRFGRGRARSGVCRSEMRTSTLERRLPPAPPVLLGILEGGRRGPLRFSGAVDRAADRGGAGGGAVAPGAEARERAPPGIGPGGGEGKRARLSGALHAERVDRARGGQVEQ